MLGRFDEAKPLAEESRKRVFELTGMNFGDWVPALIASYSGDHKAAVGYLRPLCTLLRERGERFYLSSVAPELGRELCVLGEYDEAEQWAELTRGLGVRQSALGEARWRQVLALVHAARGQPAQAEPLARQAVEIILLGDVFDRRAVQPLRVQANEAAGLIVEKIKSAQLRLGHDHEMGQ